MKIFGILIVAVMLAGCATTSPAPVVTREVPVNFAPPTTLYNCPQLNPATLPDPDTLTNKQLADIIVKLLKDNATCGANMGAIQNYIARASKQIHTLENQS